MKKTITLFLALLTLAGVLFASASTVSPVLVIGDEDTAEIGRLKEPIVLQDIFVFTVDKCEFREYGKRVQFTGFSAYCTMFNESVANLSYADYITGARLVFRDRYEYQPVEIRGIKSVKPLLYTNPEIIFQVPKLIESSKEPLVLYLMVNGVEYAFKVQ